VEVSVDREIVLDLLSRLPLPVNTIQIHGRDISKSDMLADRVLAAVNRWVLQIEQTEDFSNTNPCH
jgi:hypothetical protein